MNIKIVSTKIVSTFTASIHMSLMQRHTTLRTSLAKLKIQEYVNAAGICVTYTDTEFIYQRGSEPGLIIGLMNYPGSPSSPEIIKSHAITLAMILLKECNQLAITVVMPRETLTLSAPATSHEWIVRE